MGLALKMKSDRFWIIFLGFLVIIAGAITLFYRQAPGEMASIYHNGYLTETVNLAEVTDDYRIILEGDGTINVIEVKPGRIRMLLSDCPDKYCVNQGWKHGGPTPIVCLPNQVLIVFEKIDPDIDAATG